jgi:hypothetical protein
MKRLTLVGVVVFAFLFLISASNGLATPCNGDFTCDGDVDSDDVAEFLNHFGRSQHNNPCDPCILGKLPKTGQTTIYTMGDDGHLQKGVAPPNPRFTDNEDGTVTDNLTGLIWLKNSNCFGFRIWLHAVNDCYYTAADGECGLTDGSSQGDWRLPNYRELISLVDVENHSPALPSGHPFTISPPYHFYWTSSTYAENDDNVWILLMDIGLVMWDYKSDLNNVWCVRNPL